jgi:hypothetical protein
MNASQQLRQAFAELDANGDGTLNFVEVTSVAARRIFAKHILAREPTQAQTELIFKALDTNNTDYVTLDDFIKFPFTMLRDAFTDSSDIILNIAWAPWRFLAFIGQFILQNACYACYYLLDTLLSCWGRFFEGAIFIGNWLVFRIVLPFAGFCFAVQLLVVVVHGILFLSCDLVEMLVWLCVPKRWQVGSMPWIISCLVVWLLVLASASPLLFELLKQPLVILWSQAGLAVLVHRQIVQGDTEADSSSGLLSTKLYKRFRRQRHLSALRVGNGRAHFWTGITFGSFLTCYVITRVNVLVQTPLRSIIMSVYLLNRMINIVRTPDLDDPIVSWKFLGTVTPVPVLLSDEECEGDEHDECAVCLSKLCTSVGAMSLVSAARRRCGPSFSATRLRHRASCAGLSAMRTPGLEFCKETLTGMWGRMTTLPCGHKFHAGCIDSVASIKLQCPTCRGTLGDDWLGVQPEQKLLYKLGLAAIFAFYCVVYLWHMWLMREDIRSVREMSANVTENVTRLV